MKYSIAVFWNLDFAIRAIFAPNSSMQKQSNVDTAEEQQVWLKGVGGEWPQEHPLPLSEWGTPRDPCKLPAVEA